MNFEKTSVLAKLLARENITVQHGAYRTAFFDVERRVLGLPIWKDKGKDVYDLLVGHEVGHALFTPSEGWHDSQIDVDGIPRSYLNVVEDIRIERMIQAKYPGLVASFKRGYSVLDKDDFFGTSNLDVDTLGLMDRINLKAKLRDLIDVSFSSDEQPYVDAAFAANTWEEVVAAARSLFNFLKEKSNEPETTETPDLSDENPFDDVDTDGNGSEQTASDGSDESEDDAAESGNGADGEESERDQDASESESNAGSNVLESNDKGEAESKGDNKTAVRADGQDRTETNSNDIEKVVTDENFRNRESELLETDHQGRMPTMVSKLTRTQLKTMITTTDELFKLRDARAEKLKDIAADFVAAYDWDALESDYSKFNIETKKYVNLMAKEFEMRKAAYQTMRAQTARSGSLNVDKLYNYKFTDDVFKRVTNLADAKSHGMVMVIDYSGSMAGVISDVIRQTLILASFCKKVNIPFDVYSFTSGSNGKENLKLTDGQCDSNHVIINQLLSSNAKKAVFDRAYKDLFAQSVERSAYRNIDLHAADIEGMGGTPLNETLMAMEILCDDFKSKYNLQKTTLVALTDGAAQNMYIHRDYDLNTEMTSRNDYRVMMQDEMISVGGRYGMTSAMLKAISKKHTTIGYFLTERNYDFKGAVWDAADGYVSHDDMAKFRREYNKNKFISFDNAKNGYDKYFVIKADKKALDADEDEFEVRDNAKKGEIQRAFKKFAGSKKTNRVFATQFAEAIA